MLDATRGRTWDTFLPPLGVGVAFVYAASSSWRKWGSLVIDTGREWDVPRRISEGEVLYRDVRYEWGPLAPYLNGALYRIFGVHLDVLIVAGLAAAAFGTLLVYGLGRLFVTRALAAAAAIAFVFACAFPQTNPEAIFNFVLPHNTDATYGSIASMASLYFLIRYSRGEARAHAFASGAFLWLTSLTKLELLAPVVAAHLAVLAASSGDRRRELLQADGCAVLLAASVYGGLTWRIGSSLWSDNVLDLINPSSKHYNMKVAGLLDLRWTFADLGVSLLLLVLALATAVGVTRWTARRPGPGVSRAPVLALGAGAVALAYFLAPIESGLAVLPFVDLVVLVVIAAAGARSRDSRESLVGHLALWAFALATHLRRPLAAGLAHYGYYLAPVNLVSVAVLFQDYLPRMRWRWSVSRAAASAGAMAILLGSAAQVYRVSRTWHAAAITDVRGPRGHLRLRSDALGMDLVPALERLPRATRAVGLPQGLGAIFLMGMTNGDSMSSFLPMDLPDRSEEDRVLARWARYPPDLILICRDCGVVEFGMGAFGEGYGSAIARWVERNYRPIFPPTGEFVVAGRRGLDWGALVRDPRLGARHEIKDGGAAPEPPPAPP